MVGLGGCWETKKIQQMSQSLRDIKHMKNPIIDRELVKLKEKIKFVEEDFDEDDDD